MTTSTRRARPGTVVLVAALVVVLLGLVLDTSTPPAEATHRFWDNESQMVNDGNAFNRLSMVLDPGRTFLLSREKIAEFQDFYTRHGFTPNFTWYSFETRRFVAPEVGWTACDEHSHTAGTPCSTVERNHTIGGTFGHGTELNLYEFEGTFIARGCGNFTLDARVPVPTITGTKYDDRNANGIQDVDEAGVAGWQMTLTRVSSAVSPPQPLEPVATVATDGNGDYRFELDGELPGTYVVTEGTQPGWVATTSASRTVEVEIGQGSKEYADNDFGNRREVDIAKVDFRLVGPPARIDVGTTHELVVEAVVTNNGPMPEVDAEDVLEVSGPPDCVLTPPRQAQRRTLRRGEPVTLTFRVDVTCAQRSFHTFTFTDRLDLLSDGVTETDATNNTRTFAHTIEVFEPADLRMVEPLRIACGERRVGPSQFTCTVVAQMENGGPATAVATRLDVTLSGAPDCVFDPAGGHTEHFTLDRGQRRTFAETWRVSCTAPTRHTFLAVATVATDEPHAEDRTMSNNTAVVRWVPMDVKPGSDPSSVNIGKQGTLPFAVLSTPDFAAPTEVVVDSLLFGRTGYEDSVRGCKTTPEDVNLDSFADLVCHADTQATALACGDDTMTLTGRLEDGTPFESQDAVKPTGCTG